MSSSVIGALRVNLGMDSAQFQKGARAANSNLAGMKKQFLAVTGVAAAMGAALAAAALRGAQEIDKAAKSARRLDSSIGGFRALELAADEAGVSLSGLTNDIQTMNRELASIGTSGNGQRALDALKLSLSDLEGLDADAKLAVIADQVKELGLTSGEATAILRDLGVRNREMALLVLGGGDAIRAARTDIRDYGLEISAVDAAAIERANDQIGRLGLITQYAGQQLAQEMVPALGAMAQAMTDSLKAGGLLRAMIDGLVDNISTIAGSTAVLVGVLGAKLAAAMAAAAGATGVLTGAFVLLKRAIFATGFGALVIGAGFLVGKFGDLVKATGSFGAAMTLIKDVGSEVWGRIKLGFTGLSFHIEAGWLSVKASALDAFAGIAESAAAAVNKVIGAFVGAYQAVKAAWSALPTAFKRIGALAVNGLVDMIGSGIGGVLSPLNAILEAIGRDPIPAPDLSAWKVEVGEATDVAGDAKAAFDAAFNTQYIDAAGVGAKIRETSADLRAAGDLAAEFGSEFQKAAIKPLKSIDALRDVVSETSDALDDGADTVEDFNNALDDTGSGGGGGSAGKAAKAIEKVKSEAEAFKAAMKDAALTAADFGKEKANVLIGGIDGVANAFGDFIGGGLKDFKSFAKSILSSFTGMISQMVAMAAKQKIMFSMGITPEGGAPGKPAGGLGGLGDMFKGGIFGKTGFFGSTGASIGKSLGSLIGGAGSKLAVSLGSLGSAIGAAVPVIGAVVAAISFFKTKTTELNTGLRVTTEGMTALVDTFRTLKKVKFWGLSKKVTTTYDAASAEVAGPIQSAIETIGERVMALSDTLGLASDNIKNTSFEFEISTKGKTDEQIQAAITAEMTRLGNNFADAAIGSYTEFLPDEAEIKRLDKLIAGTFNIGGKGGEDAGEMRRAAFEAQKVAAQTAIEVTHLNGALAGLQREGEGSLAMLERIVGNLHGVNQGLYLFDRAALELGIEGAKAATALVDAAGGLEAFANNTTFVFENMMTSAAQEMRLTEIAAEKLNSGLGALGIAIPETHAEFMEMLNGQDLMTEAGRNTHAALLDVAQAFVQVNGTAQAAADAIAAQNAAAAQAAQAAAQAAQNARAADVAAGLGVAKARADAANAAMADADAMLRAAFAAERQRLSGSQTTSIDTSSVSARVGLFDTIRDALARAYADRRVLTALGQKMRLTDATAFLRSAVSSGGTSDVDRLEAALDAVADPSTALFGSFADYRHDYNVNTNLIERLKGLTDDSLSVEEKTLNSLESQSSILQSNNASQLAALDAQMNALLGIDNSVLSLGDAIAGFQSAKDAVSKAVDVAAPASTQFAAGSFAEWLNGIYLAELGREVKSAGLGFYGDLYADGVIGKPEILADIMGSAEAAQYAATGIPAFASGGYHTGGVRLVGENGPELEVTGPSRIYSAPQTRNMLGGGNNELAKEMRRSNDLAAKVEALTTKVEARLAEIQNNTKRSRQLAEATFAEANS